jgi:hypothetical protein
VGFLHGIGGVGVLAGFDGFEDAQGVVFCEFCLCGDFRVVVLPDRHHLEERGGCAQSIDSLSVHSS